MAVFRPPRLSKLISSHLLPKRYIQTSIATRNWHERDGKGGYDTYVHHPFKYMVKEGFKMLPGELQKLKEEWITKLRCDSCIPIEHGDYQVQVSLVHAATCRKLAQPQFLLIAYPLHGLLSVNAK